MIRSLVQRRLLNTLRFSARGLQFAWRNQEAVRVELVCLAVLTPLALWLGNSGVERALLILPCLLVLVAELLNSAIEAVVDLVSPEQHRLAAAAKDMGSAAVLIALLLVPCVWAAVLLA